MPAVVSITSTSPLVQYNQAGTLLSASSSPVPIPLRTVRGDVLYIVPRPSVTERAPQLDSLNSALSAGRLVVNPNGPDSPVQPTPDSTPASTNGSPFVSLGAAAQSIAAGLSYQYYNAVNVGDILNSDSFYSPETPIYGYPASSLQSTYLTNSRQTPPSTASSSFRQMFSSRSGQSIGQA